VLAGKAPGFIIYEDRTLRFHNLVCVLAAKELKKGILNEGHNTSYSVQRYETNILVK